MLGIVAVLLVLSIISFRKKGAAAGMSVAAGYDYAYHNDEYFEKYLGEFGRK